MKKILRMLMLATAVAALLCVAALAADPTTAGIYNVTGTATITPKASDGTAITATTNGYENFYANTVKFDVSASGYTSGEQCLLVVLKGAKGSAAVTADSIAYIKQGVVSDGSISFTAYPKELEKAHYCVYLLSNSHTFDANNPVGEFDSYVSSTNTKLGDVDGDGNISAGDAVNILQAAVGKITLTSAQKTAADIDGSGSVTTGDAVYILQHVVGKSVSYFN